MSKKKNVNSIKNTSTPKITQAERKLEKVGNLNYPTGISDFLYISDNLISLSFDDETNFHLLNERL